MNRGTFVIILQVMGDRVSYGRVGYESTDVSCFSKAEPVPTMVH